jgi:hypothetical protein
MWLGDGLVLLKSDKYSWREDECGWGECMLWLKERMSVDRGEDDKAEERMNIAKEREGCG